MISMSKMGDSDLHSVLEAVKKDDTTLVSMYLSQYPELFDASSPSKHVEHPFLVACKHGSRQTAEIIARLYPRVLRVRDREGCTALHLACSRGHGQLVELLLQHDAELCLEKDECSMIPLQKAVEHGYTDVIKTLIAACPQTVQTVTPQKETLFHLAAKHFQPNAFRVLLEEVQSLKKEHLLHLKDLQGDNVIHIAVSKKLIEIIKLLFPETDAGRAMVRVNTLNKKGLTACDLCRQYCEDISTRDIGQILSDAGGLEARLLPVKAYIRWTLETANVVLVVLGLVTGAVLTTVCNLPKRFLDEGNKVEGAEFQLIDVLSIALPRLFYLMVFNTAILIVSLVAIAVLLWSLPFRPVVLFVTFTLGIVYGMLVNEVMPKISIRIQNHRIFGCPLVGIFAVVFILLGAMAYYTLSWLCRCIKWVADETWAQIISPLQKM